MVEPGIGEIVQGFGTIGQFLNGIFNNRYAMFFVVLAVFYFMLFSILKRLLSKIPFFEGSGDMAVNKEGNIVAACISLLTVLSLGWMTRTQGPEAIINSIAGPFGSVLVWALTFLLGFSVYRNLESHTKIVRLTWSIGAAALLLGYLSFVLSYNYESGGFFAGRFAFFIIIAFIATGIALFFNWRSGP